MGVVPRHVEFSFRWTPLDSIEDQAGLVGPMGVTIPVNQDPLLAFEIPNMRLPLHEHQLRTVQWMINQERLEQPVVSFARHTAHVAIPPFQSWGLQWRLRAECFLRGGIVSDAMGNGKTSSALGLVMSSRKQPLPDLPIEFSNLAQSSATLVIVPSHLLHQWRTEVAKFCGRALIVLFIDNMKAYPPWRELCRADLVLVSANLFKSESYKSGPLGLSASVSGFGLSPECRHDAECKYYMARLSNLRAGRPRAEMSIQAIVEGDLGQADHPVPSVASKEEREQGGRGGNRPNPLVTVTGATFAEGACIPLEMIYWRRIILDEIHELSIVEEEKRTGSSDIWTLPIRSLVGHAHWGLSGTPSVQTLSGIHHLGLMLGAHVGTEDFTPAVDFVERFLCRSPKSAELDLPPPIEQLVCVRLSLEEMSMYKQFRFENADGLRNKQFKALCGLVQQANNHMHLQVSGRALASAISSPEQHLDALLEKKKRRFGGALGAQS